MSEQFSRLLRRASTVLCCFLRDHSSSAKTLLLPMKEAVMQRPVAKILLGFDRKSVRYRNSHSVTQLQILFLFVKESSMFSCVLFCMVNSLDYPKCEVAECS